MCGIAALLAMPSATVPRDLCARFDRLLVHRGPDASGFAAFRRDGAACHDEPWDLALIHRRLSIIDLDARSNQPMVSSDERYVLIYNGEIYNYVELREELARLGHVFRTTSDSEVLMVAVAEWGVAALRKFTGMFAFVLLDRKHGELLLARDPFGIKPLFWSVGRDLLAIASEIAPLLEVPGVARTIDARRTCDFLAVGRSDADETTMFSSIRNLPAGTWAKVSLARPSAPIPVRYWSPTLASRPRPAAVAAHELRDLLLDTVKLHLRSDVPVGIALSGGLDSSTILACARAVGGPNIDIRTFSFAATGSDVDETAFIELAARDARAQSHIVKIQPQEIIEDIDSLIAIQGEPFGSLSIYAQHRVMQLAGKHGIKVMLNGQGADELFAGYRPYLARRLSELLASGRVSDAWRLASRVRRLPGAGTGLLLQAFEPFVPRRMRAVARRLVGRPVGPPWIDMDWFAEQGAPAPVPYMPSGNNILHEALAQSLTDTVLPALLRYEDRNGMAFSLESRVPFLTAGLADFAYSLTSDQLIDAHAHSKSVLRAAMRGVVPDEILDRRDKIGFATPDRLWLRALQPWFDRVLSSDLARSIPWLRSRVAMEALKERGDRSAAFGFDLWRTINVVCWIERFGVDFA